MCRVQIVGIVEARSDCVVLLPVQQQLDEAIEPLPMFHVKQA